MGTAKAQRAEHREPVSKPLIGLHLDVKTPPFTAEGRQEAGMLIDAFVTTKRIDG